MNLNRLTIFAGALLLIGASSAWAIPTITVEDAVIPGGTASTAITIQHTEASPNTTQAGEFRVTYDTAKLSSNAAAACVGLAVPWSCSENVAGTIQFVSSYLEGGNLGNLSIDITFSPATPNVPEIIPLNVTNALYLVGDAELPNPNVNPGSIEILPAPEPDADFTPDSGTLDLGSVAQNGVDPTSNVVLNNVGGVGTQLDASCSVTTNPTVFSVTNESVNDLEPADGAHNFAVSCDASQAIQAHVGELTCTHNGNGDTDASPVVIGLACNITAGPQPTFSSSNPAPGGNIDLTAEQGDVVNPSQTVTILNIGADNTTLEGSCVLTGVNAITLSGSGNFSVPKNGMGSVTVECDTASQDTYNNTLSCTPTNATDNTPVDYPVSCEITEPGAAVFASSPGIGPIDVDGGADVVVDDTDPTSVLTFFNNADPGDQNLDIECVLSGDSAISVDPDITGGIEIAPGANSAVTFTCDTSVAGDFTATYACFQQSGGLDLPVGDVANAVYDLSCEVRNPEAQVEPSPPTGTPFNTSVELGGTATFEVVFPEVNDEGEDGELVSCSLSDGSIFAITSPASFPQVIGSGASVTVTVEGTDPGSVESFSDTLTCLFSDSDDDETTVTYPLNVTIGGGDARFTVLKDFSDGNPGEVTVDLDCNTGLILDQEKTISEDGIGVTFVVTDFDSGELDCNVTERPLAGYSADFEVSGDSEGSSVDDPAEDAGCYWVAVDGGDENTCTIINSPLPVDVVITKEWLYPGSADASAISDYFELEMRCTNAAIEDGYTCGFSKNLEGVSGLFDSCRNLSGEGDTVFTVAVTPGDFPGGSCYVQETWTDPAVEVDNGCAGAGQGIFVLDVSAGSGDSCTITNTVFFEGIPTLNQYGMALMALLMLGMGFVAVRRVI